MIELVKGDITKVAADAIVNAANSTLLGGGGVDGAIHRAGGKAILDECRKIRETKGICKIGEAVITTAGNLPVKYVIHTVGPVWGEGKYNEEQKLADAYTNSLQLAIANKVESIAFPNISTGAYRFPKQKAAEIAVHTVKEFLSSHQPIKKVIFVCYDEESYEIYKELIS